MRRPVVALHGFTGSPASWKEVLRLIEDDAVAARRGASRHGKRYGPPVFAPAILGHDGTPGPAGVTTFEGEVDRLAAAIWDRARSTRRKARPFSHPVHLVGYSMGARVGLGLLVRHPELFAAATLIGVHPGLSDPEEREARATADEEWARLLEEEGLDTFVAAWEALPMFASQNELAARARERQRRIRGSHDPAGLARSLRVVGLAAMPDYWPALEGLTIPIRLVTGARDEKFRALARAAEDRLPHGASTVVPDTGHNVVLEHPNAIAGLLREDMA